ncbi:MAG: hypothetical protein EB168_05475 [Euryarchaeota archaeon]|nr:hypothetical protein [Euryarchaeota archaeon]
MSDKEERNLVRLMMARRFYEDYSEYKGWEPWEFPYVSKGALLQADLAVDYLGFDDELVEELRKEKDEIEDSQKRARKIGERSN